ncbi:Phenylacetate-coenzyme A ligase [Anaerohalosphaera lusitana]|uniref:Phenylacetate-coenzyme A ligase n=1 Tax=Anaerohalosphaera lusitana TaxID=1936003 RepID=A0A1U9NK16_9BACT|nr:phenylacetate--CoA ligase [Anaerohalosphaera lusitana]AQT68283.1 Phenylacetate-coenzyme A ligase [Anaerohalosphaera lusitana]
MQVPFWDERIETASRGDLEALQLERLKKVVDSAFKTPFYKKRLAKAGMSSSDDIKSLEDLKKIPFTTKDDLRKSFPKGLLACDMDEVNRIHSSSGTTGIPTVIYFSGEDVDTWTDLVARCVVCTGASKKDVFQNMMTYGLFTGGLGLHYGAEKAGMTVIPVSSGNTLRQVQIMQDFQTSVVHATPSYMLHIRTVLDENDISLKQLNLQKAFIGAEPHSENVRKKIEELYNIDAYNSYGLSEMNGPGLAFECVHKAGMHFWEDGYIVEIVDPETDENLEDGEPGEVIVTNLIRHATPLMRYRTRDLASILPGQCECGRTHRRLSRIKGRTDDMLIINGVNVFPSQIEEVIMKIPEVGTNYQICLDKQGALDRLTVQVEIYSKMFTGSAGELENLRHRIVEKLKGTITIKPLVKLHEPGFLPVYEGKAKRVIDERPKDEQ